MKHILSSAILVLILALGLLVSFWILHQEMTHLYWFLPGTGLAMLLLFALHFLVFGSGEWKARWKRVSSIALTFLGIALVAALLLRYEGSASGSSFPKLSWVWKQTSSSQLNIENKEAEQTNPQPTSALDGAVSDLSDFLGAERDGMLAEPTFGTDWDAHPPTVLWRRPIGKGWSSFVVSGSLAFTQEQIGDDEHVSALNLIDGSLQWTHADPNTRLLLERAENGGQAMGGDGPRATPTLYEGKVYSMGSTGIVNCLLQDTGELLWSRHLMRDLGSGTHRWGMANSPLILPHEQLVVFAGPDHPGPTLIACDLTSGETQWIYQGSGASYSSPRLVSVFGHQQILSVNREDVCGIDPATGTELWSHPWPGNYPKTAQALLLEGDRILATSSYGAGSLLLQLTKKDDGSIVATQTWKSNFLKTKFSSPFVIGDHAYGLDEGRLACIDLSTGKRVWKNEKFGFGQHLLFGDWLLVQAESGEVVFGQIAPGGFTEHGRLHALSSMTWNTPAVAGRVLLVRNDREAAAWLLPPPEASHRK